MSDLFRDLRDLQNVLANAHLIGFATAAGIATFKLNASMGIGLEDKASIGMPLSSACNTPPPQS